MIGRHIGVYRLDEEIGRGGMGAVYRATRTDGEFEQTVAIKLIKRGMDTDMILSRFRRERQILASLNHPNIAYFLGGGSTEDGLPYFVMEFINGLPLYKFCNRNELDTKNRLLIFRQVCWAVAAAHEIKVIHRDLKPSNILVKDDHKPKLLDFGIAKVLDPDLTETDGEPTATQIRAMTPEYASPEQISGEPIGDASDVYALGVILYELLSGHRPYKLRRQIPDETARVIREEMPTNPSSVISRDYGLVPDNGGKMTLEALFAGRNATPEKLRRDLSGDLDKIVLKALRKRPEDRYRSVMALADDITNFLDGRPVSAEFMVTRSSVRRPHSYSIAILPFKVQNLTTIGDNGQEFVGIGLADALISRLSRVQRLIVRPTTSVLPFEESSSSEAATALGVDFVLDGTVRIAGTRIRVSAQLYDAGENATDWAKAFDKDLGDVLELEDSIAEEVATALLPQLTSEERGRLERRGTNVPEAYEAYMRGRYFWSRFSDDGLRKAVAEFQRAIELDPDYAYPYIGLADYYSWAAIFGEIPSDVGFPKAQEAARHALAINDTLGEAYAALAFTVLFHDWNWADAEYLAKRAIELSPNYSFAHEAYSNLLVAQGRYAEGIKEILKAEELDPVSPRAILMSAWTYYQTRDYERAEAKARKAYVMQEDLPQAQLHLGNILTAKGEYAEAVILLRKAAESWSRSGLPRYMLAHARAGQNDAAAIRSIIVKLYTTEREHYMKPFFIAISHVAEGDFDKAFKWLEKAVEDRDEWLMWLSTEPKLDSIRNDPRFFSLLERTNNPRLDKAKNTSPDTSESEHSIAVLPFQVIKGNVEVSTEDDYLSIGLADAVTMRLSNVRKFVVRPTSSVLSLKDTDPFASGLELGVEYVINGIIRRIGDQVRVTAQLLDVKENATRWSATFSENIGDILMLEDSISEQVTRDLLPKLIGDLRTDFARRSTASREAHDAYLQGRYFWNQFTPDAFPKSFAAFSHAVELDPNYALAHAGIADYYTWNTIYGVLTPQIALPEVERAARRALEIDPSLAEAHAALGIYYSNAQQWSAAEESYRKALEINPNYALGHEWLSALLVGTGRFEEGVSEILLAERLDPLSIRSKVLTAWTIYQAGQLELAYQKACHLEKMNPEYMQSHLQLANILLEMERPAEALRHIEKAIEIDPTSPLNSYVHCFALVLNDRLKDAEAIAQRWESIAKERYIPPYFLGVCSVAIGDHDKAISYLDDARAELNPWITWLGTEPKLRPLHNDQRFIKIVEESHNPILQNFR